MASLSRRRIKLINFRLHFVATHVSSGNAGMIRQAQAILDLKLTANQLIVLWVITPTILTCWASLRSCLNGKFTIRVVFLITKQGFKKASKNHATRMKALHSHRFIVWDCYKGITEWANMKSSIVDAKCKTCSAEQKITKKEKMLWVQILHHKETYNLNGEVINVFGELPSRLWIIFCWIGFVSIWRQQRPFDYVMFLDPFH